MKSEICWYKKSLICWYKKSLLDHQERVFSYSPLRLLLHNRSRISLGKLGFSVWKNPRNLLRRFLCKRRKTCSEKEKTRALSVWRRLRFNDRRERKCKKIVSGRRRRRRRSRLERRRKSKFGCSSRSRLLNGRKLGWDTYCCGVWSSSFAFGGGLEVAMPAIACMDLACLRASTEITSPCFFGMHLSLYTTCMLLFLYVFLNECIHVVVVLFVLQKLQTGSGVN